MPRCLPFSSLQFHLPYQHYGRGPLNSQLRLHTFRAKPLILLVTPPLSGPLLVPEVVLSDLLRGATTFPLNVEDNHVGEEKRPSQSSAVSHVNKYRSISLELNAPPNSSAQPRSRFCMLLIYQHYSCDLTAPKKRPPYLVGSSDPGISVAVWKPNKDTS